MATATRKNRAMFCMAMAPPQACRLLGRGLGGIERRGQPLLLAVVARPLPEPRPADAGRAMPADEVAVGVLAQQIVEEDVLGDDDVAFHSDHLGDVGDAARAVAQARDLHDHVDRSAQHLANGAGRQRITAHGDHRLDAGERLARAVGVQRAHRAVMAGIHGLQQIERLGAAHLADDDALRAACAGSCGPDRAW